MGKLEFLQRLSERLSEELPRGIVLSNLKYYENYIDDEVKKGRSINEVMGELGDPYMIARTIIDGLESDGFTNQDYADETVYAETIQPNNESEKQSGTGYDAQSEPTYEKTETYKETVPSGEKHEMTTMGNHGCLIAAIVLILIVLVLAVVVGKVIRFLWPVLMPVLIILLIYSIIKDKNR